MLYPDGNYGPNQIVMASRHHAQANGDFRTCRYCEGSIIPGDALNPGGEHRPAHAECWMAEVRAGRDDGKPRGRHALGYIIAEQNARKSEVSNEG